MEISKILNNNVAVVMENNEEKIVMGRGICFKKKTGDTVEANQIDKVFYLENPEASKRFKELVVDISLEYLQIGEEMGFIFQWSIISIQQLKELKKIF